MVCRGFFFAVDAVVRGAPFALEMVGDQLMTSDRAQVARFASRTACI